jgi:hypothetical protein
LEEAQKSIEERAGQEAPDSKDFVQAKAMLSALKGDFDAAKAEIPAILKKNPPTKLTYHHAAYAIACIYALEGASEEAVKWLKETAATGFPNYLLFERGSLLSHIRRAPEYVGFMA